MHVCSQCPNDPACRTCLDALGTGDLAAKVQPPRPVRLHHLASGRWISAELRAVSRVAVGIYMREEWAPGRYELELATDFRIIGSTAGGIPGYPYVVLDIEKVLRKQEVFDRLVLSEFHLWHLDNELETAAVTASPEEQEELRKQLIKRELDKLSILHHIHDIRMFIWEKNRIRPLGYGSLDAASEREVRRLVLAATTSRRAVRGQVVSGERDQVFDVHVVPLPDKSCGIAVINITEVVAAERQKQRETWEWYSNVLSIVSNGRLALVQDADLYELIRRSEQRMSLELRQSGDLAVLRQAVREALSPWPLAEDRLLKYTVAVNEAATNTLRHSGSGSVDLYIDRTEACCRAVVYDEGKGMSLAELPKATLVKGYSTARSLGAGFHVMLQYADRLLINTSPDGTKIVLELDLADGTARTETASADQV